MTPPERYDAIVIGAGQAGGPLAGALAASGRRTALIEREHVGGTCINEGCTPTKTMVASGRVAYLARRAAEYGIGTGSVTVDMHRVRERKRAIVKSFRAASLRRIEAAAGLELICGEARFTGPREVAVGGRSLAADLVFINTGGRPAAPRVEGLDRVPSLDSTSIMELDRVPRHLIVLGGGYVGIEFAQMFRRFGSRVTVVQRDRQLLPLEDEDVADAVLGILREDGIEVWLESEPYRAEPADGGVRLMLRTPSGERTLEGSHVLGAVGRVPNTDGLALANAGVATDDRGYVTVNPRLETSAPGVYALGDVKGGPAFTHISYDDFRVLRTNLLGAGGACITDRLVPYTVFMDPQLGRIGLNEKDARRQGRAYRVARLPMSHVARALEVDESRGFMKALVQPDSGAILGAAVLGIEGGELMAMLQLAMMGGLRYDRLRDAVFAHPTLAESLNNLFSS
ncbi:MAG TPA: mercuric reductase [Gemmatimonadales bacterium]|nr:mercuric reductase [Gemmatimonadales bacterium]